MMLLDPGYAWFWITVSLLIAAFFGAFFGWLLYRIGSKIGQVADALVARNKTEAEWQNFANEFDRETEDQVEDALDEKLK